MHTALPVLFSISSFPLFYLTFLFLPASSSMDEDKVWREEKGDFIMVCGEEGGEGEENFTHSCYYFTLKKSVFSHLL